MTQRLGYLGRPSLPSKSLSRRLCFWPAHTAIWYAPAAVKSAAATVCVPTVKSVQPQISALLFEFCFVLFYVVLLCCLLRVCGEGYCAANHN